MDRNSSYKTLYLDQNSSSQADVQLWNDEIAHILAPNTVILICFLIIGLIGNGLVIVVYKYWKNKAETEERYMIPILAVCDLLASVILSSFHITLNMRSATFTNNALCKTLCFMNGFLSYLSIVVLLIISVQRYFKMCRPGSKLKMSNTRMKCLTIFAISFTAILASPIAFFYGSSNFQKEGTKLIGIKCKRRIGDGHQLEFIIYGTLLVFILIAIIITLSSIYIRIGHILYLHFKKRKHSESSKEYSPELKTVDETNSSSDISRDTNTVCATTHLSSENTNDGTTVSLSRNVTSENMHIAQFTDASGSPKFEKRILKALKQQKVKGLVVKKDEQTMFKVTSIFLVITVLFVLCFIPRVIVLLLEGLIPNYWTGLSNSQFAALVFVHQMYLLNNIVNPIVYGFMDRKFKTEIKRLFKSFQNTCC